MLAADAAEVPVVVKTYLPLADPELETRREQLGRAVWALGRLRQVGPLQERRLRRYVDLFNACCTGSVKVQHTLHGFHEPVEFLLGEL